MSGVPPIRVRPANGAPVRRDGAFVVYWMTACRRVRWSFALERALEHARALERPLVVLEALRCGYRWASDRMHRFILDGMRDNAARLRGTNVLYYPYVEPEDGAGKGLLTALGSRAAVIVTDDYPCFMLPRMTAAAARKVDVRLEAVDGNGLLPMRATDKVWPSAYAFRRTLHKTLPEHLAEFPAEYPLRGAPIPPLDRLPREIEVSWPRSSEEMLAGKARALSSLPIDHAVGATGTRGGSVAGAERLREFLESDLDLYAEHRNEPERDVTSRLSPYLHLGHVSTHEILAALAAREGWSTSEISGKPTGQRKGWWGFADAIESFLDELVTWRELGFNFCSKREDHDRYESLPDWARDTLEQHADDERAHVYSLDDFENARTHDPLWNAAQIQLVREGRIHNYLRMVWGKKILEWTDTPVDALGVMVELNNKYALDGRDPNSYSGIFWVLGRYDRPWGPEREIFGKIRYMSSENTARKVDVDGYIRRYR